MASLLNMLNNFLGSTGASSLFNINSINTTQDVDFKNIVSGLLSSGDGDQQIVTGLLPDTNSGVDLPLSATAGGNGLPPVPATATLSLDASLPLPDTELASLITLDGTAPGEPAVPQFSEDGELIAPQTPDVVPAISSAVIQPTPPVDSPELQLTPEHTAPMNPAPLQTPQLGGAEAQTGGGQNSAVNAVTPELVRPAVDPLVQVADVDADPTRPVKLDSIQPGIEQDVESQLNAIPRPSGASAAEPRAVVSTPIIGGGEVPAIAMPTPAPLPADGRPQLVAANDASVSANQSSAASTAAAPATQNVAQPAPQPVTVDAATLSAKDPQQFALEQPLGNGASSDNDGPAEVTRQTLVPHGPALRPAQAPAAQLQATDPNFANVAAMLNQGQAMNNLNERLQFMLVNGQNSAEIQLDPPELGSLQVRVTTRHEQTSVIFVAPNTAVRDALEQQLPRLRDTLEGAGLQLQNANVFAQTEDKPGAQQQSYADVEAAEQLIADALDEADSSVSGPRVSTQLVDAYI